MKEYDEQDAIAYIRMVCEGLPGMAPEHAEAGLRVWDAYLTCCGVIDDPGPNRWVGWVREKIGERNAVSYVMAEALLQQALGWSRPVAATWLLANTMYETSVGLIHPADLEDIRQGLLSDGAHPIQMPENKAAAVPTLDHGAPKLGVRTEGKQELIEHVVNHVARFLGEPCVVYHEHESRHVHIDVHVIASEGGRPVTLFTSGMSQRIMNVPDKLRARAGHAELMMTLPSNWDYRAVDDPRVFWPIAWLRYLARLPFRYDTFLYQGHSVGNMVDPSWDPRPTEFDAALLLSTCRFSNNLEFMQIPRGQTASTVIWAVAPIYQCELDYHREHGTDALLDRFDSQGLDPEIVTPGRLAVC